MKAAINQEGHLSFSVLNQRCKFDEFNKLVFYQYFNFVMQHPEGTSMISD